MSNDNSSESESGGVLQYIPPPPLPPPPHNDYQSQPHRKSVTWSINNEHTAAISAVAAGHKRDSKDSNASGGSAGSKGSLKSTRSIAKLRHTQWNKRYTTLSRRSSNGWLRQKCGNVCCCGGGCGSGMDTDSDEEYEDFKLSKMREMDEEEIIGRLQQAVHELTERPTSYEIDAEIQKWHRTLEIEQQQYEDSGKPKFKYKWFRKNQYLTTKKHPLYGTNYENHRKLEVRLEEFRFGTSSAVDDRPGAEAKSGRKNSYESKNSALWRSTGQVFYANLALLCCASNFLRFPQACYANGGFTFLLTYCLMVAAVGQPLLYFEMVLGQYSLHGPSGFANLHPYAVGIPYAIAFVTVVFGTSRSVYLAYCILYSLISLVASPGMCGWWWTGDTKCVPYVTFEEHGHTLKSERARAVNDTAAGAAVKEEVSIFSVELYFREVMLDAAWRSGAQLSFLHWKLVIAYVLVCALALVPIHYNLSGKNMKRYLKFSSICIPAMMVVVLFHQLFSRGAMSLATQYFLTVDRNHVSALSLWSEAFEMVLSTLGIGYGYHWSISGNVSIDYRDTYKISWRICGIAVLLGLISSLVLFCEIGIVGDFTGDNSHYYVFLERLGISFVCFSGALIKLGGNTVTLLFVFFLLFVLYGMWSQIIVADVILRWIEQGIIIKGRKHTVVPRKKSTLLFLIGLQLLVISPYYFSTGGAVLASENIFGGSLAAYTVVLAELLITLYFYGFPKFLADLEIMSRRPSTSMFQFQIRYLVIPTIVIFMLPMILNVYLYPSIYLDRNKLGWLFYLGLMANFAPIFIMVYAALRPQDFTKSSAKVTPMLFPGRGETMEEIRKRYPLFEPTFVAKVDAPSQTSHRHTIRSEIYDVVEHNMEYVHKCQDFVKIRFSKLLAFKRNQSRWLKALWTVLAPMKIKSMRDLIARIMLARKYRNDRVDIRFLEAALEQIVNLTFGSAIRKLQRMPVQEMLLYLADELLKLTTFRMERVHQPYNVFTLSSSSSSSSSGSSSDHEDNPDNWNNTKPTSSSSSDHANRPHKQYLQNKIHRKLIGQMDKNAEESRTLLMIRLKRGLELPHGMELSVLRFLRRQRAKQERELSCWTQRDTVPIDHFVPSSISNKNKEKVCFTIFHAVVVEGSEHFALKRLPVPRPPIVRVTKSFVQSRPGKNLTDKFAHIVTRRMHKNIGRIIRKRNLKDMSKRKLKRHLWRVSDRVDDDVYDFLDRILTCVIVIVPDWEAKTKISGPMYLTPRARRKSEPTHLSKRRQALTEFEIQSYAALNYKQRQEAYWTKLLDQHQPPDLRYHHEDSDSDESVGGEEDIMIEAQSSSGSTSTLASEEEEVASARSSVSANLSVSSLPSDGVSGGMSGGSGREHHRVTKSQFLVENETLQHRDLRLLGKKSGFGVVGLKEEEEDLGVVLSVDKIKHISARKWKHERDKRAKLRFTEKEVRLQRNVELQASREAVHAVASKSMEVLRSNRSLRSQEQGRQGGVKKAVSLESIRHLLESEAEFKVDMNKGQIVAISKDKMDSHRIESKLKNQNPNLNYMAFGKILMVDHGVKLSSSISLSKYGKLRSTLHRLTMKHN